MKIVVTKMDGKLIPVDDESLKNVTHMKTGKFYMAEVKMPRNIAFHRKYFYY